MKVILKYFKPSGRYYSSGEYETKKKHMHEIYDEVRVMWRELKLPGLVDGARWDEDERFVVLIEAPEHEHNCPQLFIK